MATQPPPVLDESDLNDTDKRLLDLLHDGRITPQYAADELDISRTYSSERLKRLVEHDHVDRVAGGLYGLADDPRGDTSTEIEQLREAARDRWGDAWTIRQLHFADGSTSAHAFRSRGRTEDGHLEKERLFVGEDGRVYADRVVEASETVEEEDLGPVNESQEENDNDSN